MNNFNVFILRNVDIPEYHISITPDNHEDFQEQLDSLVLRYEQVIKEFGLKTKQSFF